jgi:hypothetical protein
MKTYKVAKTEFGWEVWDGIAFEATPTVYATRAEAQIVADGMNHPWLPRDETAGSVLTGREF